MSKQLKERLIKVNKLICKINSTINGFIEMRDETVLKLECLKEYAKKENNSFMSEVVRLDTNLSIYRNKIEEQFILRILEAESKRIQDKLIKSS